MTDTIDFTKRNKIKTAVCFSLSLLLLLAAFGAVIYYICGPSEGYFHADCSDSLYWANASIESGRLIADNYRYAAILPFSANLWMIPLVSIFGFTMTAQVISMVIFALLYTLSLVWVFRSMRFSYSLSFISTALMLMIMSASTKMREIMWEHVIYYSLSLLLLNCLLALSLCAFRAYKSLALSGATKGKIKLFVYTSLLLLLSLCASLNGLAVIVMTTLPLFLGLLAYAIFDTNTKLTSKEGCVKLIGAGGIAICSASGFVLLSLLKNGVHADYTDVYTKFSSPDRWVENLQRFPKHFVALLGFEGTPDFLSFNGICGLLSIAMLAVLLVVPFVALLFYKKLRHGETKLVLLVNAVLFALLLFIFTCGNISSVSWRIVPMVGMSAFSALCVLRELAGTAAEKYKEKTESCKARIPITALASVLIIAALFSAASFVKIAKMPADYGRDNTVHKLTEALVENELEYGYATFWRSNAITLLSDSKVKCREILANENGAKTDYYQSAYDWYEPQEGVEKYFVLLSDSEYSTVMHSSTWKRWESEQLLYTISPVKGYKIFVFDGYLDGIKE